MKTIIKDDGDMIITIPFEEIANQLQWLTILEPETDEQYAEITALMDRVTGVKSKVKFTVIKGGKP